MSRHVIGSKDNQRLLAENELDGSQVVATPVFVDGRIYIRTDTHLYCIGDKT